MTDVNNYSGSTDYFKLAVSKAFADRLCQVARTQLWPNAWVTLRHLWRAPLLSVEVFVDGEVFYATAQVGSGVPTLSPTTKALWRTLNRATADGHAFIVYDPAANTTSLYRTDDPDVLPKPWKVWPGEYDGALAEFINHELNEQERN